jgi:hypothetical protein
VAFEPGDPDITYMMWQEGYLFRRTVETRRP